MSWKIASSRWGARMLTSALLVWGVGLATAASVANGQADQADRESSVISPPPVPANIQVPGGNRAFFVGHAVGTQNYVCLPTGAGFAFVLFTPQATLFSDHNKQVATHYFSPNPFEGGTIRATWLDSRDSSTVWGKTIQSSSDPNFVAPGAIPWLLLQRVGAEAGPDGGDRLTATTFIQRVNTAGGVAPVDGLYVVSGRR